MPCVARPDPAGDRRSSHHRRDMGQPVNGKGDPCAGQTEPTLVAVPRHGDFHNVPTAGDLGCGKSRSAGRLPGAGCRHGMGKPHCSARTHLVDEPVDNELRLVIDVVAPIVARARLRGEGSASVSDVDLAEVWARSLDGLSEMGLPASQLAWLRLTRPLGLVENTALIADPQPVREGAPGDQAPALGHPRAVEGTRPPDPDRRHRRPEPGRPAGAAARTAELAAVGDGPARPADAQDDATQPRGPQPQQPAASGCWSPPSAAAVPAAAALRLPASPSTSLTAASPGYQELPPEQHRPDGPAAPGQPA